MPGSKAASVFDRVLSATLARGVPFEHAKLIAGAAEQRHRAKERREEKERARRARVRRRAKRAKRKGR